MYILDVVKAIEDGIIEANLRLFTETTSTQKVFKITGAVNSDKNELEINLTLYRKED